QRADCGGIMAFRKLLKRSVKDRYRYLCFRPLIGRLTNCRPCVLPGAPVFFAVGPVSRSNAKATSMLPGNPLCWALPEVTNTVRLLRRPGGCAALCGANGPGIS